MNILSPIEIAYIAGIIDGEGTITLTTHKKGCYPSPTITVASSDYELISWLKKTINAGQIIKKKNYNPDKHKDSWSYVLKYNNVLTLLEYIEPYLVIVNKKKRAELILNEYKKLTPRNGRYSEETLNQKGLFYKKFMELN
ncbi:LAGLIDADG-like domain-containing protein [Desulfonispora thiosulfatigenes DSM 11270]|uniref:LAGLIDADG-like domain-containing protein n=1 Tax=Desulfonispora thiosulfatigenes DSM 11270 TaxID=656914 RepID=A0A1W1UW35_DESTI|nr:LAGLIDADG family homing endonuclease [Desulfonispora thiosulfatigenes]SMB85209.1 LAGLIDADG-like domain-containing protein [Desulfonispora thiosulfatigenes DSM 11270]